MSNPMGHRLRSGVKLGPTVGAAGALLLLAVPARPQYTTTGPSKCVACHDHDRQAAKWQKEEPVALGIKAHFNTRKQLDGAKAGTYAKAIGLADPYDLKGSCVKCHATVFRGDANAGVSCESCHGAASGYLDLHQVKGSYARSVGAGLKDLREKDRKSTRLNSSHPSISYAVFCLKKKNLIRSHTGSRASIRNHNRPILYHGCGMLRSAEGHGDTGWRESVVCEVVYFVFFF